MNTILASLVTLPKLIDGKVCVIVPNSKIYRLYKPSKNVEITDDFNPVNYVILDDPKYNSCIGYSTAKEREHYMVNKLYREMMQHEQRAMHTYKVGDIVHLFSRQGTYKIVKMENGHVTITCNRWQYEPDVREHFRTFHISDIKCLAGGMYNADYSL